MRTSKYYTVKEVTELLNVTPRTVYYYCEKGYLESYKPAGLIYITRASMNKFMKNNKLIPHSRKNNSPKSFITKRNPSSQSKNPDH